ncbi:MAG: hypothetical protein ACK4YP_23040, partial [Myxococcota bacterium]
MPQNVPMWIRRCGIAAEEHARRVPDGGAGVRQRGGDGEAVVELMREGGAAPHAVERREGALDDALRGVLREAEEALEQPVLGLAGALGLDGGAGRLRHAAEREGLGALDERHAELPAALPGVAEEVHGHGGADV